MFSRGSLKQALGVEARAAGGGREEANYTLSN